MTNKTLRHTHKRPKQLYKMMLSFCKFQTKRKIMDTNAYEHIEMVVTPKCFILVYIPYA